MSRASLQMLGAAGAALVGWALTIGWLVKRSAPKGPVPGTPEARRASAMTLIHNLSPDDFRRYPVVRNGKG